MKPRGISIDDLPGIYREEYLYAAEMARGLHDPATEWESFRDTLWNYVVRAFGLRAETVTLDGSWDEPPTTGGFPSSS